MKTVVVDNYVYPRTKYVECVLRGKCFGKPEYLPRAEILEVPETFSSLGITAMYRTVYGVVYVYEDKLPFYFASGGAPTGESIKIIENFVEEGFADIRSFVAPLSVQYSMINFDPFVYVEIKNNEYSLVGAVKYGRELRSFMYRKVVDHAGNVSSQEIRFFPPDGNVEIKVVGDYVNSWKEFLESVGRMKFFSNKRIIMLTLDLPGVVNTVRYPPTVDTSVLDDVAAYRQVSYEDVGLVVNTGGAVIQIMNEIDKIVMYYPVRTTVAGGDYVGILLGEGVMSEEEIVTMLEI